MKIVSPMIERLKKNKEILEINYKNALKLINNNENASNIPKKYYNSSALGYFYQCLMNNRCRTIEECIYLYEKEGKYKGYTLYENTEESHLKDQLDNMNKINKNLTKELKKSNKQLGSISSELESIRETVRDIDSDLRL